MEPLLNIAGFEWSDFYKLAILLTQMYLKIKQSYTGFLR